jgi:hypothetical protein
MPFWGWNTKKGGRRADRKKQDETTASEAEDNTVETADDAED